MNNFKQYLKLPEMKIFWLFLVLVLLILIIDLKFLSDPLWLMVSGIILLSIGVLIFFSSIQSAKSNFITRLEKNRLNNIISSINDGIIVYDQDFKIMVFNKAAEQIFNLPNSKIIGKIISPESMRLPEFKNLAQVIFPSLASAIARRSASGSYPQIVDISFENPSVDLRVLTNRLMGAGGEIFGFLKIVQDRTREVGLIRATSDFVTVAAHQLRTPLTAVGWALEALDSESLNASQKDLVKTGLGASNNLLKIVEDLLSVAKMEEGKFGFEFQEFDIVKFLQVVLSEAQPVAREYKVSLYFDPPVESSLMIYGDPKKLGIVFSNLLNNAIKYNIANGQVTVDVKKLIDKPYLQIRVADTGIGIPSEEIGRLFTKFFRASNVMGSEANGSGLGLYMVKNIVSRHGGKIWVESVVGRGATFYFTLPLDSKLVPAKEIIYGEE
ncbi:MAG: Uncharacterized protein Athens071426_502 [Parcubacteria group bacterium Athens0714_26]|nr:MAG: Uncharacterized protein Athens101426_493 [Parcubacteria group bacterium Athens1014_26]TSD02418.1 MAG: Uncharacterized protein Athens071426_502 [Parcubacteria group bacterium Athens0714_26]